MTPISAVMTRPQRTLSPSDTVQQAAQAMQELNTDALAVCDHDRVVGLVTARDVVVRGVASGRTPASTLLSEVMTQEPPTCYDDQSVDEVVVAMRDGRIQHLPVLDRQERLAGLLTLQDVAARHDAFEAGLALAGMARPEDAGPPRTDGERASSTGVEAGHRIPGLLRG